MTANPLLPPCAPGRASPRPSRTLRLLLAGGALLVAPQLAAQSIEERLRQLESKVEALERENAALRARSDPPAAPAATVLPGGKETRIIVGGFLMGQAEFGDAGDSRFAGTRDRFYFRRARVYVAGNFAENFEFKAELDLQGNTLGAATGQLARANEVYVGWNRYPGATLRFGQLKPAFGAEQLMSDIKTPTIERYLGSDRLTDGRQIGFSLGGAAPDGKLGYLVTFGNGNGANVSANDNSKFLTAARAYGTVFDRPAAGRLVVGANVLTSEDNGISKPDLGFDSVPGGAADGLFVGRRRGWGGDASWHLGLLDLSAEFTQVRYRPADALPAPVFDARTWHATAAYYVVPDKLQALVRREHFDPRTGAAGDETDNWTLGLTYLIKGDDIKLMVNYLFGRAPLLPDDRGRLLTRIQIVY